MYQWRKFQYFEEKPTGSYVAEELKENVECCSSGRGRMVAGSGDGMVHVLDRGLKLNFNFQAHSTSVRFIQQLKQRNMLVTVGEDEATSPQLSAMSLKVFDLDKMEPEGSSTTGPTCIQILRIFTNQFPEAKITSFLVFEEAPPILTISIGLETGHIYCIRGDVARERIVRTKLQELVIGRTEAIYFYEVDGRGPCWAFEGEKRFLGWFRGYLLSVIADQRTDRNIFTIYDLKNRLIAYSLSVGVVSHMLCEWGNIVLLTSDHKVFCIGEKDMEGKLDMLYKKNLYTIAINLVQSQQADAAATAEVLRKYATWKKLHEKGLASKDHTTLLLNCYTKLKDVAKLDEFIKGEGEHRFDVETAVKVCRAAGYHEHAMYVAKKAGKHEWYLKILLEDLGSYDEALEYISSLESIQAAVTVKEYGKILVEHKSDETIAILMKLCSGDDDLATDSTSVNLFPGKLPSPMDFVNVFIDHPLYLMNFLERYISKVKDSPAHVEIHNTLLELYLSDDLCTSSLSKSNVQGVDTSGRGPNKNVSSLSNIGNKGKRIIENGQVHMGTDERTERLNKGLALLKSAWPSHEDHPCYDVDLAVVLCEMYQFKQGRLFLYEKMKLYKEVISCYMQDSDHEGLIACCKRLGDSSRGGDPSLWEDVLKYFGELGEDCSKEVKEVLVYIERDDLLPPIIVLQILAKNPCLTLSVVKDYVARKLEQESKLVEEDRKSIDKYQEETAAMRKEVQELRTNARIFQLSKCTGCTFTLDLPAVHFMCMHSFHQRCLGDNEKECPVCAPQNKTLLEMKRSLEQNAKDHDRFFQLVRNSNDGFSVIANYFGRGVMNKTKDGNSSSNRSNTGPSIGF
ncbi:hypothetical protein KI387_032195 [Taxus chinensis]|uniref:Vacuolar protein sorting-associated protein 11 homolog n=1 Tax=Taxus chinensis TaxID=29808 RepID=A0AA38C1Q3_TAXCH|nr:hypothetical protein KI387_032195 [Taxus chinensis]